MYLHVHLSLSLYVYMYIYIYIHTHIHRYIDVYIYGADSTERGRWSRGVGCRHLAMARVCRAGPATIVSTCHERSDVVNARITLRNGIHLALLVLYLRKAHTHNMCHCDVTHLAIPNVSASQTCQWPAHSSNTEPERCALHGADIDIKLTFEQAWTIATYACIHIHVYTYVYLF